jgi:hypothetical protein
MRAFLIAAVLAATACSGPALKAKGEACVASTECGAGLLCDLSAPSPTCTGMGDGSQVFDATLIDGHPLIDAAGGGAHDADTHHDAAHHDAPHVDAPQLDAPGSGSGSGSDTGSGSGSA